MTIENRLGNRAFFQIEKSQFGLVSMISATVVEKPSRHLREMTKNAEHAMHTVVLSCTRARKQTLAASLLSKAGLHNAATGVGSSLGGMLRRKMLSCHRYGSRSRDA